MISCYVIDDEPMASEIIQKFINRMPDLEYLGTSYNAIDAISIIKNQKPQILFLDINMPEMSGFELLDVLRANKPFVILTTAYPEFALKGYEYDVVDYLMKPIPFDKFVVAVEKVKDRIKILNENFGGKSSDETNSFFLKADKKNYNAALEDILFVASMEDYLKIYLKNYSKEFMVVRLTMNTFEEQLPKHSFLRIHRSYLIAIEEIKYLEGNQIITKSGKTLPIGRTYQDNIRKKIKEMTLTNI